MENAKTKTKKKPFEKTRQKIADYKYKLMEAYKAGYSDGWNAYENLPDCKFAKTSAVAGYNNGLRNRCKSVKNKKKEEKFRRNLK